MAAGHMLEELFDRGNTDYDVTIFGKEPRVNYNRIMLSPVLSGEKKYEDIIIHDEDWYKTNNVDLRAGVKVTKIDKENKKVIDDVIVSDDVTFTWAAAAPRSTLPNSAFPVPRCLSASASGRFRSAFRSPAPLWQPVRLFIYLLLS